METKEIFNQIISKHNWYAEIGLSAQYAYDLKKRFNAGKLGEKAMSEILIKLGWEKSVKWTKKGLVLY